VKVVSAIGLSLIVIGVIAAAGVFLAIVAESAFAASAPGRASSAKPFSYTKPSAFRCLPRILPKCPSGQARVCVAFDGQCCRKFACRKRGG